MAKNSNKIKRADRRAPDPGLQVDFEPTPASDKPAEPYKPFQHSQHQLAPASAKKRGSASSSGAALGKAARAKKAKAIERADKTNQKFTLNKAKAERKKLMKS